MNLPIKTASVDVCLNFTSLEHYSKPWRAFQEFTRVLKPGGRLFLYVPFVQVEHQIPYDFFRYTRYGLAHLCSEKGLEIELLRPSNGVFETVLNILDMTIGFIGSKAVKQQIQEVVNMQIRPVFNSLENSDQASVDFPNKSFILQMPMAYCLSAIKPGYSQNAAIYNSNTELLKAIISCPNCKSDNGLNWNS